MSKPNGVIQEALLDMLRAQAAMLKANAELHASQVEMRRDMEDVKRRLTALEQTIAWQTQGITEMKELVRGKMGFGKR